MGFNPNNTNNNKPQLNQFSFTEKNYLDQLHLQSQNNQTNSQKISALDQQNPNWSDSFIQSPLEENITSHITDILSNNLLLHFIILYLLMMLLVIITCKFIIKDRIGFTRIQNNPLCF